MKFAEHLGTHLTPEWRSQYIRYDDMKEIFYAAEKAAPISADADEDAYLKHMFYMEYDEKFFAFCEKELAKINAFFSEKLAEAIRRLMILKSELQKVHEAQERKSIERKSRRQSFASESALDKNEGSSGREESNGLFRRVQFQRDVVEKDEIQIRKLNKLKIRKLKDMKFAFSEFYLSLVLLQKYQLLNFTGFRKILKKHDKIFITDRGAEWREKYVDTSKFHISNEVNRLITEVENIYINQLEDGDRAKAMKRLRVPPLEEKQNPICLFRVGFYAGIVMVGIPLLILVAIFVERHEEIRSALIIYRGCFVLILMLLLIGLNTYGWRKAGVNHVLIFEIDPRHHLTQTQLCELSLLLMIGWMGSLLLFLWSDRLNLQRDIHPLAFIILMILFLINPIHIFYRKSRYWLLNIIKRIFAAPFYPVKFADFWLADQMNSLVSVFVDFQFFVCFYSIEVSWLSSSSSSTGKCSGIVYGIKSIFQCLPAWFRFAQCLRRYYDTKQAFPHLVNAGKYSTTFLVILMSSILTETSKDSDHSRRNAALYLLIIARIVSSIYTYTWDVKMDWGLLDTNQKDNTFLREQIVYEYKSYYYISIVGDLILRFSWISQMPFYFLSYNYMNKDVLDTILILLEVTRRFVWNFFRLENEHLNNCGMFRAVRDISIMPIKEGEDINFEDEHDNEQAAPNPPSSTEMDV
ncbi:hypothetical protein SNEBB_008008 [Seison nebaliae]|nr:hypothetical protein SNEBB_008008 [Seison nebaliae]